MTEEQTPTDDAVMTTKQAGLDGFNLSLLDPSSYEEPKETIPCRITVSRFRWSDPEYNKATEFRVKFPVRGDAYGPNGDSIQQWDLQLERLDAVFVHEDGSNFVDSDGKDLGSEIPVRIYAGVDLEKMDKKTGNIHPLAKARGKEPMVVNAWTKMYGSLVPDPSTLEGQFVMVERYREKEIAPNFFAKNVTLPTEQLPPTYEYSGDVQRFKAKVDGTGTSDDAVQQGAAPSQGSVSVVDAAKQIDEFLKANQLTADSVDVAVLGHPNFPADARIEPFTTAFATGNVAEVLKENGVVEAEATA